MADDWITVAPPVADDWVDVRPMPRGGPGGAAKATPGKTTDNLNAGSLARATSFVSSGSGGPVQKAMAAQHAPIMPIDDPAKLPRIGATAIASLPVDPQAKALYLATSLFPGMAPGQALQRMGFDGQRLYYVDFDGKAYFAEPKFETAAPGKTAREIPNILASGAGPALPTIGAVVGGIAGGPEPGSVIPAAGGAMLGDSLRQAGARAFTGELQNWMDSTKQLLGEGVMGGAGQLAGVGIAKGAGALINKNPMKVAGYDIDKMTPARIAETQANSDLARNMGITVTPGEAGDFMSLLINQRQLGRQPEGASMLSDFYKNRNLEQIPEAWSRYTRTISPEGSAAVANRNLNVAAGDTLKASRAARSARASDLYTESYAANPTIASKELDAILATPAGKQALASVRTAMQNDRTLLGVSDPELTALKNELVKLGKMADPKSKGVAAGLKLQTYDLIKRALYDIEQGAKDKFGNPTFESTAIGELRKSLTAQLDTLDSTAVRDASGKIIEPGKYAQARKLFETDSPEVESLQKGIVGLVAKEKANALQNLPKTLFSASSSDPYSIAQAKAAFQKAGKMDEWNAAVRSFLDNTFDEAVTRGGKTGPAYQVWKSVAGNTRQLANLKAALGESQFQGLQDFMKVMEMVSRALPEGSPTATDLGSRGSFAGGLAKGAAGTVRGLNPLDIPKAIADKIVDVSAGKNVEELVKAITNPDAVRSLRRLRTLPPGGKAWIREITYLGSVMGWANRPTEPQMPIAPGGMGTQ